MPEARLSRHQSVPTLGINRVEVQFLLVAAIYFLSHGIVRVLVDGSLELDEAEQLVLTQTLELGYGVQPPLYVWLQWLVFQITGPTILGLAFLKQTLLFAASGFFLGAARRVLRDPLLVVAATAALILIPKVAWDTQRDLTHSVLVMTGAAAVLWSWLRVLREGALRDYAFLGLASAVCFLGKYNGLLFVFSIAAAAGLSPELRRVLSRRGLVVAFSVFLIAAAPHLFWLAKTVVAGVLSLNELGASTAKSGWVLRSWSIYELLKSLLEFAAAPAIFLLLLSERKSQGSSFLPEPLYVGFLRRTLLVELGLLSLASVAFGPVGLKGRWFLPLLFFLPLLLFASLPGRFQRVTAKRVLVVSGGMALLVLVAMPLRTAFGVAGPSDQTANFESLVNMLEKRAGGRPSAVAAASDWLGGNIRLVRPDWLVLVPGYPAPGQVDPELLIWQANQPLGRAFGGLEASESVQVIATFPLTYRTGEEIRWINVGRPMAAGAKAFSEMFSPLPRPPAFPRE